MLVCAGVARGQSAWDTLAVATCACITDDIAQTRADRANLCLLRAGRRYEELTLQAYGLSIREPSHRAIFVDSLSQRLAATCDGLADYVYRRRGEPRWRDVLPDPSFRYVTPKLGAAAGAGRGDEKPSLSVGPQAVRWVGTLRELAPDGNALLEVDGERRSFYLPAELRREHTFAIGLVYTLILHRSPSADRSELRWVVRRLE